MLHVRARNEGPVKSATRTSQYCKIPSSAPAWPVQSYWWVQVGHVQQLGSLPVSLLQLPAATQAAPTLQGGSTSVTVALALGERPWLLQRHVSSGVETAWPRASPLCSPRVLRAVALTLPAGDEEAPHRHAISYMSASFASIFISVGRMKDIPEITKSLTYECTSVELAAPRHS